MARRTLPDIDNLIIRAVMKIGSRDGIGKVSAQKVAAECDISHFTCFQHFGTVRGMLDEAAKTFDRRYMRIMKQWLEHGADIGKVWDEMLSLFVSDPEGTLFYNEYTFRFGFDPTSRNERSVEFLEFAKAYFGDRYASDDEYLLYWDFITSMAFYYAEKIIHGYIENTPEKLCAIRNVVFNGIEKR